MACMETCIRKYRMPNYDLSCSEATLKAANEAYGLQLDERVLRIMSGFSGGLMREDLCGAITGAVASLSLLFTENVAHQSPLLKEVLQTYLARVDDYFGSTNCACIKATHRDNKGQGCNPVIYDNARLLDEVIRLYEEKLKEIQKNI